MCISLLGKKTGREGEKVLNKTRRGRNSEERGSALIRVRRREAEQWM